MVGDLAAGIAYDRRFDEVVLPNHFHLYWGALTKMLNTSAGWQSSRKVV